VSRWDVIVIGAGPAGVAAAIAAADLQLKVLLVDKATDAGGQVYRAPDRAAPRSIRKSRVHSEGDALRARVRASGVDLAFDHRVWFVAAASDGFEISAVSSADVPLVAHADALIIATGTIERVYPRPGWTVPGVVGLGAATLMIKGSAVLPGRRVLVAGPGPLAALAASLVAEAGGQVVALVDPNPSTAWLRALPSMSSRPDLLVQGLAWMARLQLSGVPILRGWDVESIGEKQRAERVTVVRVDPGWRPMASAKRREFSVDAVCLGYGLTPATEFYRVLGAEHDFSAELGGWTPRLDAGQRTSVAHLYAAGDGGGVLGVAAAPIAGTLAALSTAHDLGRLSGSDYRERAQRIARRRSRVERFGRAIGRLTAPRSTAVSGIPDETTVCRCEDVTAGELRTAIARGASEMNALKSATRCGMGPCGGRMCGDGAAALLECAGLERRAIGYWTPRPPLSPVSIESLTGTYAYSDIPLPPPAPA
jgi:thioredoxin reductase